MYYSKYYVNCKMNCRDNLSKKIIQHNFLQIIKMDLQSKKVSDEMKVDLCTKYFVVSFFIFLYFSYQGGRGYWAVYCISTKSLK